MSSKDGSALSSRALTRESGTFTRVSLTNRSLQRGLLLLRAFCNGAEVLGNGELAARTGLARPTVSRLTQTLVEECFLEYDFSRQGYRLAAVVLSLSDTFSRNDRASDAAFPKMKALADRESINVGLAVADQLDMVYVASLRESRRGIFRRAVPGSRFPIELTAGGRAYIAALEGSERFNVLRRLSEKCGAQWLSIKAEIDRGLSDIDNLGYCVAQWAPGMTAIGAPMVGPGGRAYAVNVSYHSADTPKSDEHRYGEMLLSLTTEIHNSWVELELVAVP